MNRPEEMRRPSGFYKTLAVVVARLVYDFIQQKHGRLKGLAERIASDRVHSVADGQRLVSVAMDEPVVDALDALVDVELAHAARPPLANLPLSWKIE